VENPKRRDSRAEDIGHQGKAIEELQEKGGKGVGRRRVRAGKFPRDCDKQKRTKISWGENKSRGMEGEEGSCESKDQGGGSNSITQRKIEEWKEFWATREAGPAHRVPKNGKA